MTAGPLVLYLEASMKVPPKRKGNLQGMPSRGSFCPRLNESPSKGWERCGHCLRGREGDASMKAPTKSRGNRKRASFSPSVSHPLIETPSK